MIEVRIGYSSNKNMYCQFAIFEIIMKLNIVVENNFYKFVADNSKYDIEIE